MKTYLYTIFILLILIPNFNKIQAQTSLGVKELKKYSKKPIFVFSKNNKKNHLKKAYSYLIYDIKNSSETYHTYELLGKICRINGKTDSAYYYFAKASFTLKKTNPKQFFRYNNKGQKISITSEKSRDIHRINTESRFHRQSSRVLVKSYKKFENNLYNSVEINKFVQNFLNFEYEKDIDNSLMPFNIIDSLLNKQFIILSDSLKLMISHDTIGKMLSTYRTVLESKKGKKLYDLLVRHFFDFFLKNQTLEDFETYRNNNQNLISQDTSWTYFYESYKKKDPKLLGEFIRRFATSPFLPLAQDSMDHYLSSQFNDFNFENVDDYSNFAYLYPGSKLVADTIIDQKLTEWLQTYQMGAKFEKILYNGMKISAVNKAMKELKKIYSIYGIEDVFNTKYIWSNDTNSTLSLEPIHVLNPSNKHLTLPNTVAPYFNVKDWKNSIKYLQNIKTSNSIEKNHIIEVIKIISRDNKDDIVCIPEENLNFNDKLIFHSPTMGSLFDEFLYYTVNEIMKDTSIGNYYKTIIYRSPLSKKRDSISVQYTSQMFTSDIGRKTYVSAVRTDNNRLYLYEVLPDDKNIKLTKNEKRDLINTQDRYSKIYSIDKNKDGEWKWSNMYSLPDDVNLPGKWQASPTISNSDGEVMIFEASQTDVVGLDFSDSEFFDVNTDLFVSFRNPNTGEWSEPKNLGLPVNTPFAEKTPYIHPDGKTLYFSSNGHPGLGDFDIFVTRRMDSTWTNWSKPVNLGKEINSTEDELYFKVLNTTNRGFFVRNNKLWFEKPLPKVAKPNPIAFVKGDTRSSKQQLIKEVDITLTNEKTGNKTVLKNDPVTGEYYFIIPLDEEYNYEFYKEDFIPTIRHIKYDSTAALNDTIIIEEHINLYSNEEGQELLETLTSMGADFADRSGTKDLKNVLYNMSFVIPLVTFTTDSDQIEETSKAILTSFAKLIVQFGMKLYISGHTDSQGSAEYNLDLSKRRVTNVKNFLIENGCQEKNINVEYFGSEKPIDSNENEDGRRKNRRVEFKIISLGN